MRDATTNRWIIRRIVSAIGSRAATAWLALTVAACTSSVVSIGGDSGIPVPIVCNGTPCGAGEICCYGTGQCFDPNASPDSCPRPPIPSTGSIPGAPCAADSQCPADQYCGSGLCLGDGFCQSRLNTGSCGVSRPGTNPNEPVPDPGPGTSCQVCGCNGVTYNAVQVAGQAGVRIAADGACGVGTNVSLSSDAGPTVSIIGCGTSSQCPAGSACCGLTGHCFNTADPWRCIPQADGTLLDCRDNSECGGGRYCAATDGCNAPGRCVNRGSGCDGVVDMVCGCDGHTYTNECWATSGGSRIASHGACP